jgi:hypothetical protein
MNRFFTPTFFKFFFGFLFIIAIAFGVLLATASQTAAPEEQLAQPN